MSVINYLKLGDKLYLVEKQYGKVHLLDEEISIYGDPSYYFVGNLHKGEVELLAGKRLEQKVPEAGDWNYGFTLEGEAKHLFRFENALVKESKEEGKTFVYITNESKIFYAGLPNEEVSLHFRLFDSYEGRYNFRWVVIYAD